MQKASDHPGRPSPMGRRPARRAPTEPAGPVRTDPSDAALARAATEIQARCRTPIRLAIVLGSGFGAVADVVVDAVHVPYDRIPGFARSRVPGHSGRLVIGKLGSVPMLLLAGRLHYYEGHDLGVVTFPIRVLAALGIRTLLLTNAAGGIDPRFRPGDFMVVSDHLNFMGANPLRGAGPISADRFVDLSRVYSPVLRRLLVRSARQVGLRVREGVYAAVSGPSYETPAEIRALGRLGADAIGMSTVPEAIVARYYRLEVAAISCITNLAAGRSPHPISHADVLAAGGRVRPQAAELLSHFAALWAQEHPAWSR